MHVITISQLKGGVGKTTIAVNLAAEICRLGCSVTLVDADPQGGAMMWAQPGRLKFGVRELLLAADNTKLWLRDVLKIQSQIVIVDTQAGLGQLFEMACFISDLLIAPCGPSSMDIISAKKTIRAARGLEGAHARQLRSVVVPTRVDLSNDEGCQIVEELEGVSDIVSPTLSYDSDFVRAFASGSSLFALAPGATADLEMRTLTAFVLKKLYLNDRHLIPSVNQALDRLEHLSNAPRHSAFVN